jgi:hypothetical protein
MFENGVNVASERTNNKKTTVSTNEIFNINEENDVIRDSVVRIWYEYTARAQENICRILEIFNQSAVMNKKLMSDSFCVIFATFQLTS